MTSLVELSSKAVACYIPFEVVEHFPQPIPEQLQLRIAFWSFPENEEDIRYGIVTRAYMYSTHVHSL